MDYGQVLHPSLCFLPRVHFHVICLTSFVTEFVNFYAKTLVFLGYVLSENDPSFVQTSNFVDGRRWL
jgi:hypothetical protein